MWLYIEVMCPDLSEIPKPPPPYLPDVLLVDGPLELSNFHLLTVLKSMQHAHLLLTVYDID